MGNKNKLYNVVLKTDKSIEVLSIFDNEKLAIEEMKNLVEEISHRYDCEMVNGCCFLVSKTDPDDSIIYSVVSTHSEDKPFVVLTNNSFCNIDECATIKDAADKILEMIKWNHEEMVEDMLDICGRAVARKIKYKFLETRYAIINCVKHIETC